MSLRVWAPLNNSLDNLGTSGVKLEAVTTASFADGKIGKCLSGGKIKISAAYVANIFNNEHMSICFWYNNNTTATSGSHSICGFSGNSEGDSGATRIWDFFNYSTPNIFHWSMGTLGNGTLEAFPANTWVHIAVTFDGSKLSIYKNGELAVTQTGKTSAYTFDKSYYISFGNTPQKLNDFRIYDECLSPKQIKEISKGLIAHYKLDTPRTLNNLKRNSSYGTYNNYGSSGSTCTVVDTGTTYMGSKIYRMTYTPNDTSLSNVQTSLWSHGVTTPGQTFKANTKYCFWTLCKPISHLDSVVGGTASNIGGWIEIPMKEYNNGWYIVGQKRNGTVTSDKTDTIYTSFKTPSATSGTPIVIDFCCPHLIEGYDEILPEYDYAGTALTQEFDYSGNNYNGKIYGAINYNPDSIRYSASAQFGGTCADYIYRPIFTFLKSPFTFNCWIYQTSATSTSGSNTGNTLQFIMGQGRDCGYAGFALCSANGYARIYLGTQTSGTYYTINDSTINLLNNWHMLTGTFDGTTAKLYVDGILKASKESAVEPSWDQTTGFVLGKMSYNATSSTTTYFPFVGSISDAKIYATALSANEILTTYKNSGIIDNKGNVYAYEFKEE